MLRALLFLFGLPIAVALYCGVSFAAGAINPALGGLVVCGTPLAAFGLWVLLGQDVRRRAAEMARRGTPAAVALALLASALAFGVKPAVAQAPQPPETVTAQDEKGRSVTLVKGFDLNEWGGTTDPACSRTELDAVELREEVGSADEPCVIVLEWSLKNADQTITSGFYSFLPREWIRLNYEQTHDRVRFVGTMWYVPQGWNAHMLSADLAGDWQVKNPGLVSYVGLSPTDPWVSGLWQAAEAQYDGAPGPVATVAPPVATPEPPTGPDPVNPLVVFIQRMVVAWNGFWSWVFGY